MTAEEVRYAQYSDDFDEDDGFEEEYIEDFGGDYDDSYHNYDPVKTTPAYHIQQAERALEQLKFIVEESGWKKAHAVRGGATIYSKNGTEDNDKVPVYMCEHVIDGFAPQPIFAVIGMRKLWDPWYEEGNLIENLNDTTSLTYMVMNGVAGVRTRDLSLVEKIECISDGTIYFVSTSVMTDKVPRVTDKVRAHLHLNGWILKPIALNPPRTKITYILQTKVNGWVPSIVAKKYLIKRPLVVHTIDRYLQKNGPPPMVISSTPSDSSYPSRSVSGSSSVHLPISTGNGNNVDRKSKLRNNKSIIVQHSLPNGRPPTQHTTGEPPVHSSEEDKEPSSSPPLSPSSPKQATFQQKIISNQPSSIPVQESTTVKNRSIQPTTPVQVQPTSNQIDSPVVPTILTFTPPPPPQHKPQLMKKIHRHTDALDRAVANFKDNAKNLDGWNFHSETKGVKIYTKNIEGRTNPATRGEYTIIGSYTASDLLAAAKNSNLRKTWDDRYEDGVDLEILNKDEVLTRTTLKGTFPISARDLALVGTVEHDPETGRIIYVTTSIVDPAIPEVKKCVRANLVYTGWQIDPRLDINGNTRALNIIYIVDIDIKLDSVPTSILRSISSGTPMVLYNLDETLRKMGFPPYVLNSTSLVLSEKIDPKSFEYDLSLIAENDGIAVIRLSKTMYPNGFDVSVTPENTKVELLSDTSVNIRITLPSEVLTEELQIKITRYTSNGFKMTYNGVNEIPLAPKETSPKVPEKVKLESMFTATDVKSTRLSGFPKKTISRSVELRKETETSQSAEIPKETETTSRSLEISKKTETVESSLRKQHSRRPSQSILINNINSPDSTDGTDKDDRSPRKQKRLSFANSPPNIINSEPFNLEEEKKTIERVATPKITSSDDEYNKYEAAIKEIEELEAMKEMDSVGSHSHIEYPVNKFDINEDIISVTDNVKFNSYQAGLMFLAMLLAYYAGKLSHSKINI